MRYPGHSRALRFIAAVCLLIAAATAAGAGWGIGPVQAWALGGLSAWALSGAV